MIKKVLGLLYLDTMILQAKRDKQQKEDLKPTEMQIFMKAIYPNYRDNPRVDILLHNTDFGVGK